MSEHKTENGRTLYFDFLRILSAFAVVMLHVSSNELSNAELGGFSWYTLNFYHGITRFCVPVFVMLSGALFLDTSREITLKRLYCRSILRLFAALVFWKIVYMGAMALFEPKLSEGGITAFLKSQLTEPYHLWFLRMLIGLYIAVPIFRKIASDKRTLEYFLLLSFVCCYCVALVGLVPGIGKPVKEYFDSYLINVALGYGGYFCMGLYLHKYEIARKMRIAIYALGAASFILTVAVTCLASLKLGYTSRELYTSLLPTTCFMSAAVFLLVKSSKRLADFLERHSERIKRVSALTFGAYLTHILFLMALDTLGVNALTFMPLASVPALSIAVFALSLLLTFFLRKVPFVKRYLA